MIKLLNRIKSVINRIMLAKFDKSEIILYNDNERLQLIKLIESREVLQNRLNEIDDEINEIIANAKRIYRGG